MYFLLQFDKVVYVGRSRNFQHRITMHMYGGKVFNRFYFLPMPEHMTAEVEAHYIRKLKPELNTQLNDGRPKQKRNRRAPALAA